MSDPYLLRTYIAECLDPVHIGTGEFRLGRVDNTIVREPGTNLPKIPGSSLAGVARAYTAMKFDKYRREKETRIVSCAGKGGGNGDDHCGEPNCQVCTAFGFSKDGLSFQGLAQFSDARLLFFPVASLAGPVWITCPSSLEAVGCVAKAAGSGANVDWLKWNDRLDNARGAMALDCGSGLPDRINLGWLYLALYKAPQGEPEDRPQAPAGWTIRYGDGPDVAKAVGELSAFGPVLKRLVLVSDRVFSVIVEDQLEVRTSVSISPQTGAAESGALFTYEALPRATFLFFQITCLDPTLFQVPVRGSNGKAGLKPVGFATAAEIAGHVASGLSLIQFLGVGGSNTRGLGRLKVFPEAAPAAGSQAGKSAGQEKN
jgi:CRISPR-associated protein Cmr4